MTGFVSVYLTASSLEEAREIGRSLVEARLAACANVMDGIDSIYFWNGAIEESREAALILKSRADLVPEITKWVKELHSYTCPCVVAWPISGGNQDYLDWIARETRSPDESA